MIWYIGRRLLQMIPVFLGATLLVYGMTFLTGGNPIDTLAGDKPISPAVLTSSRRSSTSTGPSSCSGCCTSRAC